MENASLEIFLHGKGQPKVVFALFTESLRELLQREDALPSEEQFVFVGEADEERGQSEEDTHEPANIELTLEQIGFRQYMHVHTRTVRHVAVTVYYNGQEKKHRFSPATTVAMVTAWAKARFNIDPTNGDLVLALKPSDVRPRPEQYLGDLLQPEEHKLEFNLVREVTPQGGL